eukprot:2969205-Alexandrium_andersonii.AAC.1
MCIRDSLSTRPDREARGFYQLRQLCQDLRRHRLALPPALGVSASEDSSARLRRAHRRGRRAAVHEGGAL